MLIPSDRVSWPGVSVLFCVLFWSPCATRFPVIPWSWWFPSLWLLAPPSLCPPVSRSTVSNHLHLPCVFKPCSSLSAVWLCTVWFVGLVSRVLPVISELNISLEEVVGIWVLSLALATTVWHQALCVTLVYTLYPPPRLHDLFSSRHCLFLSRFPSSSTPSQQQVQRSLVPCHHSHFLLHFKWAALKITVVGSRKSHWSSQK